MLRTTRGPQPKIWTDKFGCTRKRLPSGVVWVKTKCDACKECWRKEGEPKCPYGGPYFKVFPVYEDKAA